MNVNIYSEKLKNMLLAGEDGKVVIKLGIYGIPKEVEKQIKREAEHLVDFVYCTLKKMNQEDCPKLVCGRERPFRHVFK